MKNQLYYGDNLEVLRKYIKDETIDLCYIDPPFNSKRNYNQIYNNIGKEDIAQAQAFIDTWTWDNAAEKGFDEVTSNTGGVFTTQSIDLIIGLEKVLGKGSLLSYLVSMTLRIAEIYRVLKPTGSFYLHCDPTASHYLKLVIDSIFVAKGGDFLNEISWQRTNAHNFKARYFGRTHDIIFYYSKSTSYTWNQQYSEYSKEQLSRYKMDASGRMYTGRDMTITASSKNMTRNFNWRGSQPPPHRVWGYSLEKLEELYAEGLILLKADGTPRLDGLKVYLDEVPGKMLNDMWIDVDRVGNTSGERLGYPTQKPEALLERIIKSSSNPDDKILDAYCGCGTTIAVAERLNRNWIGVDITYQSISLMLKRLEDTFGEKVLETIELNGVPRDMASAVALANKSDDKTRKEFEKWAVLSFSNNRAAINETKGGDKGIDGTAYILDLDEKRKQEHKKVLFSVKSNKSLSPSVVRDLYGTMEREGAPLGFLLTLYPMDNLVKESKKYGMYRNELFGIDYPRIQVISAAEILDGKRMNLPMSKEVVKKASAKGKEKQGDLGI